MNEQHHVIWSNRDLDYDDWKDDIYRFTEPVRSLLKCICGTQPDSSIWPALKAL